MRASRFAWLRARTCLVGASVLVALAVFSSTENAYFPGHIPTVAGRGFGEGGPRSGAALGGPYSLAFDGAADLPTAESSGTAATDHLWSTRFGDADPFQYLSNVAVDGAGNVIIAAGGTGTMDFGGGPLSSLGSNDIFMAKLDGDGNHLWSMRFGDASSQLVEAIAVEDSGNIFIAGTFSGTVDFGGGSLSSTDSNDIFLAKFDSSGRHLWSKDFGDASPQYVRGVAVDRLGNVVITGPFYGTVDFGGGPFFSPGSNSDTYIAKFSGAGEHVWSKDFGDAFFQKAVGVALDREGNIVITGEFSGTVDFGGGPLATSGNRIFLAGFDREGNHRWSKAFGNYYDTVHGVDVDETGNVVIVGNFWDPVSFGGAPLNPAGGFDIFVAMFDSSGNHLWSRGFGDADSQGARGVAVDAAGNVFLTGEFEGTVSFGADALTSVGRKDVYIAKFDSGGSHLWSEGFGDADQQSANGLAVHGTGHVLITGAFYGTVNFGGGPFTSAGGSDIFVAKFGGNVSHRKVILIPGIASGTEGFCDGVRNRSSWIRGYLTGDGFGKWDASRSNLAEEDFVYFSYAQTIPGEQTCISADYQPLLDRCYNCRSYENKDTCRSIDDWTGGRGTAHLLDDLVRKLIADDANVEIDILAHSMGGAVTGYWLATFGLADDPETSSKALYERVKSVVLFDSAPAGFPATAIGHEGPSLGFAAECEDSESTDSPRDMLRTSGVTTAIRAFVPTRGPAPRIFAIDSYPGQAGYGRYRGVGPYSGIGPCDAVRDEFLPGTAIRRMAIGNLPLVGGSPTRIWARSHGVVWDDAHKNNGGRDEFTGLFFRGAFALRFYREGLSEKVDVSNTVAMSEGTRLLFYCSEDEVAGVDDADTINIGVDGIGQEGEALNKEVLLVRQEPFEDGEDPWGLGEEERNRLLHIVACAIARRAPCSNLTSTIVNPGTSQEHNIEAPEGASTLLATVSGFTAVPSPPSGSSTTSTLNPSVAGLAVRLVSPPPESRVIDSENLGPDVVYSSGSGFESFEVQNPMPGVWTFVLDGEALSTATKFGVISGVGLDASVDGDQDGMLDLADNCPDLPNQDQADVDKDQIGDVCDGDVDGDALPNASDNCHLMANVNQEDFDADGIGDLCDEDDDNDGLADFDEIERLQTDPFAMDTDGDGYSDGSLGGGAILAGDNCPAAFNPDQRNTDAEALSTESRPSDVTVAGADEQGDACDRDDDNDFFDDASEEVFGCGSSSGPTTSSLIQDSDGDRVIDGVECALGTDPANPSSRPPAFPQGDADLDGLPDDFEIEFLGTSISTLDLNGDGAPDGADTDRDGISDGLELKGYGSSPTLWDTDGDSCPDGQEIASVNADKVVSSGDLGIVASLFGRTDRPVQDIDKNGVINSIDLLVIASRFRGTAC